LTLLLCLCLGGFLARPLLARPVAQSATTLTAAQDTFVDLNNTNNNYNGQRLEVTYSNFLGLQATRYLLLQFDLAGLADTFTTETALVVTLVENNLPDGASLNLTLYTVPDQWDEATVTYATRPTTGAQLQGRTVSNTTTGAIVFDAAAVRDYLAAEYAGDQIASFVLSIAGGSGALGFAGNLVFEDREGSHDGNNGNEPALRGVIVVNPPTATATPTPTTATATPSIGAPTTTATASGTVTPPTATATFVPTAAPGSTTPTPTSTALAQTPTPSTTPHSTATPTVDTTLTVTRTRSVTPVPTAVVHLPIVIR
jgi:hypothetical protein